MSTQLSVLVLDDFQEVSDERVLAGISQLLKVAPPGFRLVVASRRDPPLPLHRLRLAGQLAEIRAEPLAFTSAEARRLLAGQGLVLSNADVESPGGAHRGMGRGAHARVARAA